MKALQMALMAMSVVALIGGMGLAQERAVDADRVDTSAAEDASGYFKASDLIGMEVKGNDNEDLGEVQDLFIDGRTHEVEYLILDTGVFADLGGKQPVIPWMLVETHLGVDADRRFLSLPLTRERIRTAPAITITDVDLIRTSPWVDEVNVFFDAELKERRVARPDLDRRDRDGDRSDRPRDRDNPDRPRTPDRDDADRPRTPDRDSADRPREGADRPREGADRPREGADRPQTPARDDPATPGRRPSTPPSADETPSADPATPDATDKDTTPAETPRRTPRPE